MERWSALGNVYLVSEETLDADRVRADIGDADGLGAERTTVRVGTREVVARRLPDGRIEQAIGRVNVSAAEVADGVEFIAVDVGNPHAVVVGDPDELPRIGPLLESHPRFPGRTNVQVARVARRGRVSARVWERGVGETSASGTSAVAVAAATHPDGGDVVVSFPGGDRAWLTGPAERVR